MSTSDQIKVVVIGAKGRMGREAVLAISAADDLELVGAVGRSGVGSDLSDLVVGYTGPLKLEADLQIILDREKPDVVLDLSKEEGVRANALAAFESGASPVIGATGLPPHVIQELDEKAEKLGVPGLYVPNFAIGAVLMMRFSEIAAKWYGDVEIIEMHHEKKEDAPSGTALRTAEMIASAKVKPNAPTPTRKVKAPGALGGQWHGVPVHSIRLPGLLAHQMVIFGGPGETFTLRHDSLDRAGFMEGVKLSIRKVKDLSGLVVGLDSLLFS